MGKSNGVGNIADRSFPTGGKNSTTKKSTGEDLSKLSNVANRADPTGKLSRKSPDSFGRLGMNVRGEIMPTGRLDNKTTKGPGGDA